MVFDQCLRIIDQNFRRHAPEPQESAFHPFEPVRLALPLRGSDMHPARIAKRPDKHMDPHTFTADPDPSVAEVDLHLMTGSRLEADRRPLLRIQFPAPMPHPALYRPQADNDSMLIRQFLTNDVSVTLMPEERSRNQSSSPSSADTRRRPRYVTTPPSRR